jgi:hypothetical protein
MSSGVGVEPGRNGGGVEPRCGGGGVEPGRAMALELSPDAAAMESSSDVQ